MVGRVMPEVRDHLRQTRVGGQTWGALMSGTAYS